MKVRFSEQMRGFYGVGAPGYDTGEIIGRTDGIRLNFRLTISSDDVRGLLKDRVHRMCAEGAIVCKEFGPVEMPVEGGVYEVFVPVRRGRYTMRYRLPFRTADGTAMTVLGYKDVGDDWGVDMWPDTTTLYTRLIRGHVGWLPDRDVGAEYARGILRLNAPMFARQLSTFRGTPAGIALYGWFFLRQLRLAYRGPHRRRPL